MTTYTKQDYEDMARAGNVEIEFDAYAGKTQPGFADRFPSGAMLRFTAWNPDTDPADCMRLLIAIKHWSAKNPSPWEDKTIDMHLAWSELDAAFASGDEKRCLLAVCDLAVAIGRAMREGEQG